MSTQEPIKYFAVTATEETDISVGQMMEWEDIDSGYVRSFVGGAIAGMSVGEELLNMKVAEIPKRKGFFIRA